MGKLLFTLLVAAGLFFGPKQAQESANMTTLRGFLEAINTQDGEKIGSFIDQSFAKRGDSRQVWVDRLLPFAKQAAPLSLDKVIRERPNTIIVSLAASHGAMLEMRMDFQAEEPHAITGIRIGGPGSQSGPPAKDYSDWKDLPSLLEQVRMDNGIPALSLAEFHDGKTEVSVVGVREAGKPAVAKLEDRWLIGSITKSMTAMAIGRLVDRKQLRWDMTLKEALPETPMRRDYEKVTLLQVLHHRGGIPQDLLATPDFLEKAAGKETDPVKVREHYAAFVLSREPAGKPGGMAYSNAGYSLLGHIAELKAKKPFEQLLGELVFQPLDMKSAGVGVPGTPGNPGFPGHLMGHVQGEKGLQTYALSDPRLNAMMAPAGGGVSMSVDDLLKFAVYNLKGLKGQVTLLSKESFDTLHRPVGPEQYACGWVVTEGLTREPFIGHNGSDGTFQAQMAIWKDRNLAIVSIMNMGTAAEMAPTLQAIKAVYQRETK